MSDEWVDLRALPGDRWRAMTLPGSQPDVELARLHVDKGTGASLSLVRFPAGWTRPVAGCYPVGEEIAVLDGALELSGVRLAAGDYGWVPPYAARTDTSAPGGALVLALFTGVPSWLEASEARAGAVVSLPFAAGRLRPPTPGVVGGTSVVDDVPRVAESDRDLLDLDGARWAFVPAGEPAPGTRGRTQVRTWSAGGSDLPG